MPVEHLQRWARGEGNVDAIKCDSLPLFYLRSDPHFLTISNQVGTLMSVIAFIVYSNVPFLFASFTTIWA